jgi:hypothetical protein
MVSNQKSPNEDEPVRALLPCHRLSLLPVDSDISTAYVLKDDVWFQIKKARTRMNQFGLYCLATYCLCCQLVAM